MDISKSQEELLIHLKLLDQNVLFLLNSETLIHRHLILMKTYCDDINNNIDDNRILLQSMIK